MRSQAIKSSYCKREGKFQKKSKEEISQKRRMKGEMSILVLKGVSSCAIHDGSGAGSQLAKTNLALRQEKVVAGFIIPVQGGL